MRLKLKNLQRIQDNQREEVRWRNDLLGRETAQPERTEEPIDLDEIFNEENPLRAWVDETVNAPDPEFDPNDRTWAEGELDDLPLCVEFDVPSLKRRKKSSHKKGSTSGTHAPLMTPMDIADLETVQEEADEDTPEPSDKVVYQTSNDSTSKTSSPDPTEDDDGAGGGGGEVQSQPSERRTIQFTEEEHFTHATQDADHISRKAKGVASGSKQKAPYKKKSTKSKTTQPPERTILGHMEQLMQENPWYPPSNPYPPSYDTYPPAHDTYPPSDVASSYSSTGDYPPYHYPYAQSYDSSDHSIDASTSSHGSYAVPQTSGWIPITTVYVHSEEYNRYLMQYQQGYASYMSWNDYVHYLQNTYNVHFQ